MGKPNLIIRQVLIGLFLWSCENKSLPEAATAEVVNGSVSVEISLGGRAESSLQNSIIAPDDLSVLDLRVSNGTQVKKGDILISLDTVKAQENVKTEAIRSSQLRLQIKTNQIRLNGLTKTLEKSEKLLRMGAVSAEEKEKNMQEVEILKSQMLSQQEELKVILGNLMRLEDQVKQLSLTSPIDGVITYQWASGDSFVKGAAVKKGELLFKISSLEKMTIKTLMREEDIVHFNVGQKINLSFVSLPELSVPGQVTLIDSAATLDKETGVASFRMYIEFTPPASIKPGMEATAVYVLQQKKNVLSIPKTAVNQDFREGNYVKVLRDGKKIKHLIQIGLIGDVNIEVLSGLTLKQKVLANFEE